MQMPPPQISNTMATTNTHISIITLMAIAVVLQSNVTDSLNGSRNNIHLCFPSKNQILILKMGTTLE